MKEEQIRRALPPADITPLRRWRISQGLTLEEVADLTDVSVPMLSRVERGQRELAPMTRVRIARLLGVRLRDLFPVAKAE